MSREGATNRFVDKIFSMKKEKWWLILIVLVGLILRVIAANNLGDSADSMHFVTHAINFLQSGKLETYDQASGLWFEITSLFYNMFGIGPWGARLAALIFGTASIFLIYLLTKEFYSEKVAIVAALLLALAPFHIKNTYAEMDVMAIFFSLGGMLFFVRAVKESRKIQYLLSGVFFGLAIYTKLYPLFFAASMIIYLVATLAIDKKWPTKRILAGVIIWGLAILVFMIPTISTNYLMYKEHGFMDLPFTNSLGIGKDAAAPYYSFDPIFGEKNDWHGFFVGNSKHGNGVYKGPLAFFILGFMTQATPIIMITALLGLIICLFVKKRKYPLFFIASIIIIYPYLGSIIPLAKHFVFFEVLAVPFSAFFFEWGREKILAEKMNIKIKATWFYLVLGIILIIFLGLRTSGTFGYMYGEGYTTSFFEAKGSLNQNALYIADSRIYRGQINWFLYGVPYLESVDFINLYNQRTTMPGKNVNIDVYYIECVYDDCGWGTIASQPEFNDTLEQFTQSFADSATLISTIYEPKRGMFAYYPLINGRDRVPALKIYKITTSLNENLIRAAIQPRQWFLYTVGYPAPKLEFDSLSESSASDSMIYSTAKWIARIAIVLAFICVLFVIYLGLFSDRSGSASQTTVSGFQIHPLS